MTPVWVEQNDVGLKANKKPTFKQWESLGEQLELVRYSIPFLLGDWANMGQAIFEEDWTQATSIFDEYTAQTIANYASCCRKVPYKNRRDDLSFSHHQAVAKLPVEQQAAWLAIAAHDPVENRKLTAKEFRAILADYPEYLRRCYAFAKRALTLATDNNQKQSLKEAVQHLSEAYYEEKGVYPE